MMISVALVLAMGCGKKETPESQERVEAPQKPGTVLWEFETRFRVTSSSALGADGTVYVGSVGNKIYALDGKTGTKKWEFKTGSWVHFSPAVSAEGILYVGSTDNKVYAIHTSSKGLAKSPWPMRGQNPQHTGRAPAK